MIGWPRARSAPSQRRWLELLPPPRVPTSARCRARSPTSGRLPPRRIAPGPPSSLSLVGSHGMYPAVHAKTNPDKPAVIMAGEGRVVTYRELDDRSNQLAQLLHD